MASYISRTIPPSKEDKDFIKTTHGGNNYCIEAVSAYLNRIIKAVLKAFKERMM